MRILVCRPHKDACELSDLLKSRDFNVTTLPTIKIVKKEIKENSINYDYLIFTSKYAVDSFFSKYSSNSLSEKKIYCIGASTAKSLLSFGIKSLYPSKYNSEALLRLILNQNVSGKRIAIISGVGGNDFLEKELSEITYCKKIEYYERVFEDEEYLFSQYMNAYSSFFPDIIIVTSLDIFKSLNRIFKKTSKPKDAIVTITSTKMLEFVYSQGFFKTLKLEKLNNKYICKKISEFIEASKCQ